MPAPDAHSDDRSNSRRRFLERFFALLDERNVSFVVLRNFDAVFAQGASDVDLLAADRGAVFAAAQDAARSTGHRLVQSVPFACHSWVWWDGARDFVRVDVDTELRWRWLRGAATADVLARRIRHGAFYIPSPHDEADALRLELATRGRIEERYARRLVELGEPASTAASERRRLLVSNLLNPLRWPGVLRLLAGDVRRYFVRRRSPAGIAVRVVAAREFDGDALARALAGLFPRMKSAGGLPREIQRARFTGGLALDLVRMDRDDAVSVAAVDSGPDFTVTVESSGRAQAIHPGSGATTSITLNETPDALVAFICECLARAHERRPAGLSIAVLGPDGSGKSTVLAEIERRLAPYFVKVDRFHLRPGLLPDAGVLLRRREAQAGPVTDPHGRAPHSAPVAFVRLCWFACDYVLGHLTRIRKALAQSHLVLFDRHAADFACDPRRYRFALPAWLLRAAAALLPKPQLTFVLLADAATLAQRKGEIPDDAVAQVLAGYARLAKSGAIGVDATRPVAEVAGEIERRVLDFMKARVRA